MAHLFSKIVLKDAIKNLTIPDMEEKIQLLREWHEMYTKWELQKKKETAFEATYSEKLFGAILGYSDVSGGVYTREKHPKNQSNGQTCDIGLGYYSSEKNETQAVVELKDAGTSIDRPQQREGNMTPIQQGFKYKPLYNSRWVIVSNYYEFRLYRDTYQDYEVWTLADLVNPANDYEKFRTFYFLLRAESLIAQTGESETEKLLAKVRIEQETITKKFYKEYSDLRTELMRDIWRKNTILKNTSVIQIAQNIIDRIVFIHFCEDRWLLPQNKLTENLQIARQAWFDSWEVLQKYFNQVDSGSTEIGIPDWYNGWLFRENNEVLRNLKISDEIITKFIELGRYDFSDEGGQLSVEILGHIFEQSISDLETIRTKIQNQGKENIEEEKKVSKRKKDGIFYTPAYIVDYIVRNSLGKYLEEHEERLKEQYKLKWDITEKNYRKRELEAYTEYQKILHTVKVLDPACGSGAFLVRVFDFLLAENVRVEKILSGDEQTLSLAETDPSAFFGEILKNNIYGVDLNEESVEITKLSLWLKSAVRGKKLQTLDNNIKCGNSLIDDPAIGGDKAFNWNTEFADIMSSGGFDVIVGNPPYGASLSEIEVSWLSQKYKSYEYQANTYVLFYEKGLLLLSSKGILWFITPATFTYQHYFRNIRDIIKPLEIISICKYCFAVFGDADIWDTVSFIVQNSPRLNESTHILIRNTRDEKATIHRVIQYSDFIQQDGVYDLSSGGVIKKAYKDATLFGECAHIVVGIKPYQTGKGVPKQTKNIVENKPFTKDFQEDTTFKLCVIGSNFHRYGYIEKPKMWLKYGEWLAEPRNDAPFFDNEKIIIRQTADTIIANLDTSKSVNLNNVYNVWKPREGLNLRYLLVILNSSLIKAIYQSISQEKGKLFAEVKKVYLQKLPIKLMTAVQQQPFIEKADLMLSLNRELHDKSEAFMKNISAKYAVEKITRKLEKWWELDFAEFLKETKIKVSLAEQEELLIYFETRKKEITQIDAQIRKTDAEIDDMVFDLYGLTEEERSVVLNS